MRRPRSGAHMAGDRPDRARLSGNTGRPSPATRCRASTGGVRADPTNLFVRETEWETAQTVWLWADDAASMRFKSKTAPGEKSAARGAAGAGHSPCCWSAAANALRCWAARTARSAKAAPGSTAPRCSSARERAPDGDYGFPPNEVLYTRGSRAVFLSDFFGDLGKLAIAMSRGRLAAASRVCCSRSSIPSRKPSPTRAVCCSRAYQGALRYDADRAESLHDAYRAKLAERRDALKNMARKLGWRFAVHRTDAPVGPTLMMAYQVLENARVGR